jgi:hypothetical protein
VPAERIHFIVASVWNTPALIIVMKYDYSDATGELAWPIALQYTFGGSPNPPTWCSFSEMVTDLSNARYPLQRRMGSRSYEAQQQPPTPKLQAVPKEVPIARARLRWPFISDHRNSKESTVLLDDLIRSSLDTPLNREATHAVPGNYVTTRPPRGTAAVKRRDILSGPKLIAEGGPARIK